MANSCAADSLIVLVVKDFQECIAATLILYSNSIVRISESASKPALFRAVSAEVACDEKFSNNDVIIVLHPESFRVQRSMSSSLQEAASLSVRASILEMAEEKPLNTTLAKT